MWWDVLLDSLIDTVKMIPIILGVYFLIEILEYKEVMRLENSRFLNGKLSPLFGSMFGVIPQCGFSVISSELYSKKAISIGALIGVYIATSDEAIPIMLSDYKAIPKLLVLLAVKFVLGILIGYLALGLYRLFFKKQQTPVIEVIKKEDLETDGCCKHHIDNKFDYLHPIIHTLKIAAYIFVFNLLMGTIIMFVGEENISAFLASSYLFQPLFAVIVGLIPNCVSSVILTELYMMGSISFGSIVAGLSVNAGIGIIVLLKENKNIKENLFIIFTLIISSLAVGYGLHFIPFGFI